MNKKMDKILLVDDERHLLISLKDCLVNERFDVVTASSGEEALDKLENVKPDLIVLDISMPGMGGLGFLRHITDEKGKTRYPVLVLTARSLLENFFKSVSVAGFLTKPCDETKLIRAIVKILATNKKQPSRAPSQRLTVLLAEDDDHLLPGISIALSKAGYTVVNVQNGPDVLDKAVTIKPDVVVMKDVLPHMNGSAVARMIDVMPSLSGIPVVLYDERLKGIKVDDSKPPVARCVRQHVPTNQAESLVDAVQAALA